MQFLLRRKKNKLEKAGKKPRVWELGGTTKDLATLERTKDKPEEGGDYVAADTTVISHLSILPSFNSTHTWFIVLFKIFSIVHHKKILQILAFVEQIRKLRNE